MPEEVIKLAELFNQELSWMYRTRFGENPVCPAALELMLGRLMRDVSMRDVTESEAERRQYEVAYIRNN